MKKKKNGVSCVFPAYNEEKNIGNAISKAVDVFECLNLDYEIIVVDDGSEDATSKVTLNMIKKNNNIRLIKHSRNFGYADALKTGFKSSGKDFIFYTDADNQFDIKDIIKALPLIQDADMVIGYRKKRADNFIRKIGSFGYNLIARMLFRLDVKDIDCAFKLFRRKIFKKIEIETKEWLVDTEILVKGKKNNMIIKQIEVKHLPRKYGKVKVKPFDILSSLAGLLNLKRIVK